MAKHCPDQLLFKAIELANTCDLNYRASRNKRLLLELTLIQLCQLTQVAVDDKKKALIEPIAGTNPSSQAVNSGQPQQPPQAPSVTAAARCSTSYEYAHAELGSCATSVYSA